ncbi:hypothetical protein BURKHO8Y_70184 [Burkholderia sp. 8Y]|uniref:hypothetical protein n=1 Tax=Burkholderia sp. 8Y TaxID=2653133 RepID=UPI0012EF27ED|nr:hypothetical protein [Burkholderia sp. 8Y]VXC97380.1 hypothetical protein BURKHO8Y_70184 [Burkholderia sp. 8Y]
MTSRIVGVIFEAAGYSQIANGAGILFMRVGQSEGALKDAFAHPGRALVGVVTVKQVPPSMRYAQVNCFSLDMLRAVSNQRAPTCVDMRGAADM